MGNKIGGLYLMRSFIIIVLVLCCSEAFAGSGYSYIDPGTSTPTANRVVKFDATGKLVIAAIPNNPTFTGTVTGTFAGTHTGNGAGLTGIQVIAGSGNDQYTKLLLHGDQVGSLSTYLDSSEQEITVTAGGSVNGTTTQSVFGGASFAFDGTDDKLVIAANPRLELGSFDFMLELWIRFTGILGSDYIINKIQAQSTDYLIFGYNSTLAGLSFIQESSSISIINAMSGSWTPSLDTWYHTAIIRKNSKFRFYVDGYQIGSDSIDTDAIVDNTGTWTVGGVPYDVNSVNGYMDEIRMSIGTGRKPAGTFTVAAEAYGTFTSQLSN